jgi:hypothetical protein
MPHHSQKIMGGAFLLSCAGKPPSLVSASQGRKQKCRVSPQGDMRHFCVDGGNVKRGGLNISDGSGDARRRRTGVPAELARWGGSPPRRAHDS